MVGLPLLEDLPDVAGQKVLVRVDYNVPLEHEDGHSSVADDFRIRKTLPTLHWLQERGAAVTACSHLGRPDGRPDEQWSMSPVRERLAEICPGVELLDNLRFDPGEKANSAAFVDRLIHGFDAYVNEAFGVAHRVHASVVGPPSRLPSAAGRLLAKEVEVLGGLLHAPTRPFVVVLGGSKVAEKLGVLRALTKKADVVAVGGAMAFTFLAALGHDVGASIVDADRIEECRKLLHSRRTEILLPTDVVALEPGGMALGASPTGITNLADTKVLGSDIPDGWQGFDIGPETAAAFAEAIARAGTVFWNGPVGAFEDERFAEGTHRVAQAIADCAGSTIVGGGDSVSAIDHLGLAEKIDFVSTGGGASLSLLENGDLPALAALRGAPNAPFAGRS
ncbi:MAG TPA: phosphoglycerate kinase [Acidimicrobiales bacterium]|nr:phosphoglycerate kinase [Acidimicrobiales bacterium]